jgi:hypothetical protein
VEEAEAEAEEAEEKSEYNNMSPFVRRGDIISNFYRGPSIDASSQVSVHLAKRSQRRRLKNRPIGGNNCLWRPCLLTDPDKISNLYRRPSRDASYQVSFHMVEEFQRGRLK